VYDSKWDSKWERISVAANSKKLKLELDYEQKLKLEFDY